MNDEKASAKYTVSGDSISMRSFADGLKRGLALISTPKAWVHASPSLGKASFAQQARLLWPVVQGKSYIRNMNRNHKTERAKRRKAKR